MKLMRIAYFSDVFLPKIDGVVTSLLELSSELGRRGNSIAIFCPGPGRGKRIIWSVSNVSIFPVVSLPTFYPDMRVGTPGPRSLLKLRRFRADLVHIQSPGPLGLEGLIGGGVLDLPVVGTFNTYFMEPEYLRLVKLDKYQRVSDAIWRIVARFYNRCDLILSPSEKTAFDLREHNIKKPIEVMPNGIDLSFVKRAALIDVDSVKNRFGLRDQVVLYVGRLSREKSLDVLLRVFAELVKRVPQAQLLIVGDGPIRDELEKLARDLGVSERVIFTGLIEHDGLLSSGIFQACSVFCTASTSEVQPMSVIEAMAAGLPIVGVRAKGMVDLVGKNGVLVEPGDIEGLATAVVELLLSEKKLKRAGKQSRIKSREHDIERVASKMEKVYRQLIK